MDHSRTLRHQRQRRRFRVRRHIRGTADRPRLSVFRTSKHIYAQIIDDASGKTLASASTMDKQLRENLGFGGNQSAAVAVGQEVAARAKNRSVNCDLDRSLLLRTEAPQSSSVYGGTKGPWSQSH